MTTISISIAVYILTVLLWFIITAYEDSKYCYTVGDVIKNMDSEHFFPIYNIISLVAYIICIVFFVIGKFIWKNLKFKKLWTKFINIKIKKNNDEQSY